MICDHNNCTGCGLCSVCCSKKCIEMIEDTEGFRYPSVDENQCVNCGKCKKVCPVNVPVEKNEITQNVISAWTSNDFERITSSSGGVFPEIAKYYLEHNGSVYGAVFDKQYNVTHVRITQKEELTSIKGSKYYQSDIRDCYDDIRNDLLLGRKVLFSGTGCQIGAILRYLENIDTSNLTTIEILCHGVPSKKIVDDYIKTINSTAKPVSLTFRDKSKFGWEYSCVFAISFDDESEYYGRSSTDGFYLGFLHELFLRESCYSCPYVGRNRVGDITLADYWRVDSQQVPELTAEDKKKGVSLVLINSQQGKTIMDILLNEGTIVGYGADIETASLHNQALKGNYKRPSNRERFFALNEKYGYKKALFYIYPKTIIGIKVRQIIRSVIGEKLYNKLKVLILKGVNVDHVRAK